MKVLDGNDINITRAKLFYFSHYQTQTNEHCQPICSRNFTDYCMPLLRMTCRCSPSQAELLCRCFSAIVKYDRAVTQVTLVTNDKIKWLACLQIFTMPDVVSHFLVGNIQKSFHDHVFGLIAHLPFLIIFSDPPLHL